MTHFPRLLYHYTNQTGLVGIISTRQFWASKVQYLNDTTEFRHGLSCISRILQDRENEPADRLLRSCLKAIRDRLDRMSEMNIFVVSFSATADLLSQWRAYSGTEIGYAVGLKTDRMAALATSQGFTLAPCIYARDEQQSTATDFVTHQLEYVGASYKRSMGSGSTDVDQLTQNLVGEFCQRAAALAPLFKDDAFQEEREWRLVSQPKSVRDKAYGVRPGRHFLIPYCGFSLERDGEFIVDEIMVGPTRDMELATRATVGLLHKHGVSKWAVSSSRIPFRAS